MGLITKIKVLLFVLTGVFFSLAVMHGGLFMSTYEYFPSPIQYGDFYESSSNETITEFCINGRGPSGNCGFVELNETNFFIDRLNSTSRKANGIAFVGYIISGIITFLSALRFRK